MLALSKKTDYAPDQPRLLGPSRPGESPRPGEIGEGFNLPVAVVANILKCLQKKKKKILNSTRGV